MPIHELQAISNGRSGKEGRHNVGGNSLKESLGFEYEYTFCKECLVGWGTIEVGSGGVGR